MKESNICLAKLGHIDDNIVILMSNLTTASSITKDIYALKFARQMNYWRPQMNDPIVEEVRKARMAHTKKFNGDLEAICKDLKAIQAKCGHKIVRLPAKKLSSLDKKPHKKPIYIMPEPKIMTCHESNDSYNRTNYSNEKD